MMEPLYPVVVHLAQAIGKELLDQTKDESTLTLSVEHGAFTVHYGHRYGLPIVIVEPVGHTDSLGAVWHEHDAEGRA